MFWVQHRMHWWTVNSAITFRERMFKNATLLTLLILFLDAFLLPSFYMFLFVCLFIIGVFFLHSCTVSVYGLMAVVPGS